MLYKKTFILTLSCPDNIGIVHAVTGFLATRQGNIIEAAQYTDVNENRFFMRIKFELLYSNSELSELFNESLFKQALSDLANTLSMTWALHDATTKMPTILMVSKLGHCFNDLLFRYKSGLIPLDIKAVVSNHREYYQLAAQYNIPFYHFPVTQDTKPHAESQLLSLIKDNHIELVVLARYMQVLSDDLCKQLDGSTTTAINIHHSFLPSFKGARPYYQAHNRGVKIIGATAHFVTADLDEGPIIEQDVARVEHTQDPEQFTAIGRDVECVVLSRAVTWFAQHRVLRNGNKTVVFK